MVTGELGKKLIVHFEGDFKEPYICPSNYVTGAVGHIIIDPITKKKLMGQEGLKRALELYPSITPEQSSLWLNTDLKSSENVVNRLVKVPIKQHQFDAIVSHVFNCGVSTTLFELINTVPPLTKSLKDWWTLHYVTGGGKKLPGLIRRRRSEYELFLTGKLNFFENE